jgi:Stage II sporulation protein E (SpoIIE)
MNSDPNPFELVTALRSADGQARAILDAWCGESITQLVAMVADRLGSSSGDPKMLTRRALRWLEMYLRARDPSVYQNLGRRTFVIGLMLATYRWLDPPAPNQFDALSLSQSAPEFEAYMVRSYTQPMERVGGDWWDHDVDPGRVLWVIIGDVTGHGYPAYLLAAGLPHLWRAKAIALLRAEMQEPRELLGALGRDLEQVLPDDLFVEAVLGRFTSAGEAVLAAAGGSHPILRRSKASHPEFHTLSGCLLGLEVGSRDQCSWSLDNGDELLLATDGLFDQPSSAQERLGKRLAERCEEQLVSGRDLHGAVLEILRRVLEANVQHDDITVITLRRNCRPTFGQRASDAGM